MKRILFSLATLLIVATAVGAQEGYPTNTSQQPTGTNSQQPTADPQQPTATDQQQTTGQTGESGTGLPATASPLPLIGMGGLTALTAGLWLSRPRRRA